MQKHSLHRIPFVPVRFNSNSVKVKSLLSLYNQEDGCLIYNTAHFYHYEEKLTGFLLSSSKKGMSYELSACLT